MIFDTLPLEMIDTITQLSIQDPKGPVYSKETWKQISALKLICTKWREWIDVLIYKNLFTGYQKISDLNHLTEDSLLDPLSLFQKIKHIYSKLLVRPKDLMPYSILEAEDLSAKEMMKLYCLVKEKLVNPQNLPKSLWNESDISFSHKIKIWFDSQNIHIDSLEIILSKGCLPNEIGKISVKQLEIGNLRLLSSSIGQLENLVELTANNSLVFLPLEFSKLQKLQILNLARNKFSFFPTVLLHLTNLKRINFSENALKNLPEGICNLTRLKRLNLSQNSFPIPFVICKMTFLKRLNLEASCVKLIPPEISKLTNLKFLDLGYNYLANLPSFQNIDEYEGSKLAVQST